MMRRIVFIAIGILVLAGTVLALQQTYPKAAVETVLENDRVIVQRVKTAPGQWVGEHAHAGNQLAVILKEGTTTFREGGEERQQTFKPGDVIWVEAVKAHDHKPSGPMDIILITLK